MRGPRRACCSAQGRTRGRHGKAARTSSSAPKANSSVRRGAQPCPSSASAACSSPSTLNLTSAAPRPHTWLRGGGRRAGEGLPLGGAGQRGRVCRAAARRPARPAAHAPVCQHAPEGRVRPLACAAAHAAHPSAPHAPWRRPPAPRNPPPCPVRLRQATPPRRSAGPPQPQPTLRATSTARRPHYALPPPVRRPPSVPGVTGTTS